MTFVGESACDDLGVDGHAAGHVGREDEDGVGAQECLGDGDAAAGAVVEGALEPLGGSGHGRGLRDGDDVAGERAHPLAPHRVALVGHRRRADLLRAEGLGQLAEVAEQADVVAHLVAALGDAGQRAEDLRVELPRIGLAADGHDAAEAHRRRDQFLQLADLGVAAVEELEKAVLGARGALDAAEGQRVDEAGDLLVVEDDVVEPERGPLADGGGLCGLVVGEAECDEALVLVGEGGECVDEVDELRASRITMRSALSVTKQLVAPRWMMGLALGHWSAKAWTWAMTSWRSRFS